MFAYIIGNWNNLARIVFESFAGLGLKASGTGFTAAELLQPGRVAQVGMDAAQPLITAISDLMGFVSFFENFLQIIILLLAWAIVIIAFFILSIQLFITLIEFKLTTLCGFVLIPFGLFGKTAFMAERVLGNVVSSGIKVLVLAVIVGIGSTIFTEFTSAISAQSRRSRTRFRSCSPAWRCLASASSAPASPMASSRADRSLAQAPPPEPRCLPAVLLLARLPVRGWQAARSPVPRPTSRTAPRAPRAVRPWPMRWVRRANRARPQSAPAWPRLAMPPSVRRPRRCAKRATA